MLRFIIQGLLLISAATLVVDAVVAIGIVVIGKRSAEVQGLPYGCQAEVDVEKRDGSEDVDFVVCVKGGRVCTTRDVADCSSVAQHCESFKPPTDKLFSKMFPKAYANVCQEPTGELCLYTDIEYNTCDEAKIMNDKVICITLSNGEEECSEIPQELLIDQKLTQSDDKDQLPPYRRPLAKVKDAKTDQFP